MISNQDLIEKAASVVQPRKVGDFVVGDVGCALVTDRGNVYLGVCIDVSSGMGFCAEHNAIGAMITAGEYRIAKIVAVAQAESTRPGTTSTLPDPLRQKHTYILSPCGRCREFMRQIDADNLQTDVILGVDHVVKLIELLPYHDWFHKL